MKYVTRVEFESRVHFFAGPKIKTNLRVDFFDQGSTSSIVLDKLSVARLYLASRDQPEGVGYKFTGPAHSDISELIFTDRPLVIRLVLTKHLFSEREPLYILSSYCNGIYRDHLLKERQLDRWMVENKGKAIIYCSP